MADPLSISTRQGLGEAQVFDASKTFNTYRSTLAAEAQAAKQAKLAEAKQREQMNKLMQDLENMKVEGYAGHLNDLYNQKSELQQYMTKQFMTKGYDYNPYMDAEFTKKLYKLNKSAEISNQFKDYVAKEQHILQKDKDNLDPLSAKEVQDYINLDLNSLVDRFEKGGSAPTLRYKPEVVDYVSYFRKNYPANERVVKREVPLPNGIFETKNVVEIDIDATTKNAADLYDTALNKINNGQEPTVQMQAFLTDLNSELNNDEKYKNLDDVSKAIYAREKAIEKMTGFMSMGFQKKYEKTLQGGGAGTSFNFGFGTASNNKFKFDYEDYKSAGGIEEVRIQRTDAGENKSVYLGKGSKKILGVPISFVKEDGVWKLLVAQKSLSGRDIYKKIPADEVKSDIKVHFGGFDLDEFLEKSVYPYNKKTTAPKAQTKKSSGIF